MYSYSYIFTDSFVCHRIGVTTHGKSCSGEDRAVLPEIRVGVCIRVVTWLGLGRHSLQEVGQSDGADSGKAC